MMARAQDVMLLHSTNWEHAKTLFAEFRGFVFRGQGDARWSLSSSLERAAIRWHADDEIILLERAILTAFKRRAHNYLAQVPGDEEWIDWLALIQHYGGPTRLVDFTRSPYVAAFFAMENSGCDAAIYALNPAVSTRGWRGRSSDSLPSTPNVPDWVGSVAEEAGVEFVQPNRMNERLAAQQGLFLVPKRIDRKFDDNLAAAIGERSSGFDSITPSDLENLNPFWRLEPPKIIKIVLPESCHATALVDLEAMNVSSTSLFSGLDGFSRSLAGILRERQRERQEAVEREMVLNRIFER